MDRRDRLGVVALAVELGHAHAAEALAADDEALAAERETVPIGIAPRGAEPTGARSVSSAAA